MKKLLYFLTLLPMMLYAESGSSDLVNNIKKTEISNAMYIGCIADTTDKFSNREEIEVFCGCNSEAYLDMLTPTQITQDEASLLLRLYRNRENPDELPSSITAVLDHLEEKTPNTQKYISESKSCLSDFMNDIKSTS